MSDQFVHQSDFDKNAVKNARKDRSADVRMKKLQALYKAERWAEMKALAHAYTKANKRDGVAWKALATALEMLKKDSLPAMKEAIKLLPNDAQAHFNLGNAYKWHDKLDEAVICYRKAITLKPDYAEAYSNLGNALQNMGQPYDALRAYFEGIKIAPHLLNIQLNMGNCYFTIGQQERGARMYQMALEIKPDFMEVHNALMFGRDLMEKTTVQSAYEDRLSWSAKFSDNVPWMAHDNDPDENRRLRIGYVSADMRQHSAACVFGPALLYHDKDQFEVFAYNNSRRQEDEYMKKFKESVDHWVDVADVTDDDCAKMIQKDKIDILVDLSGHSGGNKLLTFARKPAPVQITAWGYATGTGMKAMDYFFADAVVVPEGERQFYRERVVDLPCLVGSYWMKPFPGVSDLPAKFDGNITFGCLNRYVKITENTLRLWARVLRAVPNSGLVMRSTEFASESHRARVTTFFSALEVTGDRLILLPAAESWHQHLETLREVDICLDPYPHGGGVTTLEALMMGCPVLTLRWPTIVGRLSASTLTTLGMTDWIAESLDEYVQKAVEKSANLDALAELRKGLRSLFQSSIIGDGPAYCRAVESQYRRLWREWCSTRAVSVDTSELAA
ncbi:MAG TPA: tetratricopeptide repeat protein [Burkholderiales bacterium]|nr:tetratricopeptide repeat protein [Burkholderiales bacterium]